MQNKSMCNFVILLVFLHQLFYMFHQPQSTFQSSWWEMTSVPLPNTSILDKDQMKEPKCLRGMYADGEMTENSHMVFWALEIMTTMTKDDWEKPATASVPLNSHSHSTQTQSRQGSVGMLCRDQACLWGWADSPMLWYWHHDSLYIVTFLVHILQLSTFFYYL